MIHNYIIRLILVYGICLTLFSCNNILTVDTNPELEINLSKQSYKVGENVIFQINGNADQLSFYSGEISNDYDFREGRILDLGSYGAKMSFTSAVQGGSQEDQISIFVSSDFTGEYDVDNINKATWTEITSQFAYGTNTTFTPSNDVDITNAIKSDKPIYIGFKYRTRPQVANGFASTWMFQNLQLKSKAVINGSNPVIANQTQLSFQIIDPSKEVTPSRSLATSTRLTLLGNIYKDPQDPIYDPENPIYDPKNPIYDPTSPQYDSNANIPEFKPYIPDDPTNDPETVHWAISQGIIASQLDLGPDWAIPVKGLKTIMPKSFTHTYSMPGTYKVRFIATNSSIDESRTVHKELTITITE